MGADSVGDIVGLGREVGVDAGDVEAGVAAGAEAGSEVGVAVGIEVAGFRTDGDGDSVDCDTELLQAAARKRMAARMMVRMMAGRGVDGLMSVGKIKRSP